MNGRQEAKLLELQRICANLAAKMAELEAIIAVLKAKKPGRPPRREPHEIQ